jgi:hypothetical protein
MVQADPAHHAYSGIFLPFPAWKETERKRPEPSMISENGIHPA